MKKFINITSLVLVALTGLIVIGTFLTIYQFYYFGQMFNSYTAVQISLAITMSVWAIRFWMFEVGKKRVVYSIISLSISIVLLYLMQFVS
ncbi:MAG: hypothetical protein ACRC7N_10225 [Clostridium sp.]